MLNNDLDTSTLRTEQNPHQLPRTRIPQTQAEQELSRLLLLLKQADLAILLPGTSGGAQDILGLICAKVKPV